MELCLQFGYGMMEHSRHLVREWSGGSVILSPRDLDAGQMQRLADDIRGLQNGRVLMDSQFYLPRSDHHRLTAHDYWPAEYETNTFFGGDGLETMLGSLWRLNQALGTSGFVLPGLMADAVDDDWLETLRAPVRTAAELDVDVPIYATVALASDIVRDMDAIQDVLEEFEELEVDGVYVLAEHPNGEYLVEDPIWLANVLELCAGLRLAGKRVLTGYVNHQLLCLGAAAVNAVAAGTWMNVRMFAPDRFQATQEEEIRRRATWYYSPVALSEYKSVFLDAAWRQGVLTDLEPPAGFESPYAAPLFAGVQPSSTGFGEREAFRHYLHCLRLQAGQARHDTLDDTLAHHRQLLDEGEQLVSSLSSLGVLSQGRGFGEIFDVVRSALTIFEATRGPTLRRAWAGLSAMATGV